jgi:hypothetical protein
MASAYSTGGTHHPAHDWEQVGARILMFLWGVPLAIGGAFTLISLGVSQEGADVGVGLALGAAFLIAPAPALVAWRSEPIGGRLLMAVGVLLAGAIAIIQYIGIQHGVMRNGAGRVNPWWVYGVFDVLSGLPPFTAGLLLLDHLRRQAKRWRTQ